MAKIAQKPTVSVEAAFTFTEGELRALDAVVGYGTDSFLETFYKYMGRAYLEPHEKSLRSLFDAVRCHVPEILRRADEARKAFEGDQ